MKSCVVCKEEFEPSVCQTCLVGPNCMATYCLCCLVRMAQHGSKCPYCGLVFSMEDLQKSVIGGATILEPPSPPSPPNPRRRIQWRHRCTCSALITVIVNGIFWLHVLLAFAMGATVYPFIHLVSTHILRPFLPLLFADAVHLMLISALVWPVVRFSQKLFQEDRISMLLAIVAVVLINR